MDVAVTCSVVPADPYPIRLVGGTTNSEGRVEIFINGEWGSICRNHWTRFEASVACHQLGFSGAIEVVTDINRFGPGSGPVWLDNLTCNGTQQYLHQCQHLPFGQNSCDHYQDAGVVCQSPVLQLRLAGFNSSISQGRVEINYNTDLFSNNNWGTICDDGWGIEDADITCQMLGYGSALAATRGASPFGQGSQSVLFSDVMCDGNETSLLACPHSVIHSCQHDQDAGVVCSTQDLCTPVSVVHGTVSYAANVSIERPVEGSVVTVQCDEGYDSYQGTSTYTCDGEGVWQPRAPGCGVSCPTLQLPSGVRTNSTQRYPLSRVEFSCDGEGFVLQGPVAVTCRSEGRWTAYPPECIEVFCPPVEADLPLVVTGSGVSVGTNLTFQCSQGWHLVGVASVLCLAGGHWSNPVPTCAAGALCPALSVSHGVLTFHGNISSALTTGTSVSVSCDQSYQPVLNIATAMCDGDGIWQPQAPLCGASCTPLPIHSHLLQSTFHVYPGVNVSFSCDPTYTLEGASSITCNEGQWSASTPTCTRVSCPPLSGSDPHLLSTSQNLAVGSQIFFRCEDGWRLVGSFTIVCLENGMWNNPIPYCVEEVSSCPTLSLSDAHLSASNVSSVIGATVSFSCEAGWQLKGPGTITCQSDGTWSGPTPSCEGGLCPSLDTSHMMFPLPGSRFIVGTSFVIECDEGYGPTNGSYNVTCRSDLSWQPYTPACNALCPRLDLEEGLHVDTTATFPGTEVTFTCGIGKLLMGNSSTTCLSQGRWSHTQPTCVPATCPALALTPHLTASNSYTSIGSLVFFNCEDGWHIVGTDTIICQLNATWSAPPPTCVRDNAVCPMFNSSHGNFSVTGNSTETLTEGTTVTVTCWAGLQPLGGVAISRCGHDGNWSPGPPGCGHSCPPLKLQQESLQPNTTSVLPGTVVSFTCAGDTLVRGSHVLTCLSNGTWNSQPPSCVPVNNFTEEHVSQFSGGQIGGLVFGLILASVLIVTVAVLVTLLVLKKRLRTYGLLRTFSKDSDLISGQPLDEIVTDD